MVLNIATVILLALVGSVQAGPEFEEFSVDIISRHGTAIKFPFFTPTLKTVRPELREILAKDIEETVGAMVDTLVERLNSKGCNPIRSGFFWTSLGAKLIKLGKAQDARRKPYTRQLEVRKSYNKVMQNMFKTLMKMATEKAKKLKGTKKDPESLADKLKEIRDDLVEVIRASPTGSHLGVGSLGQQDVPGRGLGCHGRVDAQRLQHAVHLHRQALQDDGPVGELDLEIRNRFRSQLIEDETGQLIIAPSAFVRSTCLR